MHKDGKRVTYTYREVVTDIAEMTAKVEGDEFTQRLKKGGLKLPLTHAEVEASFAPLTEA